MPFGPGTAELPEGVFTILRDLLHDRTGLWYDADKRDLLADKLEGRLAARGLPSFLDYYYLLKYGSGADEEWPRVMDALSVQETYFWREFDQVRVLVEELLPRHAADNPSAPVRIWCAACATGEEPLSIAMALAEAGWFNRVGVEITATDGSHSALERARAGLYRERSFRSLPPALRDRYFTRQGDAWRVSPELHGRVRWAQVNLMDAAEVAPHAQASYVFCRNVFIYFSPKAVEAVVRGFAQRMPRPGYLFVGASESLLKVTPDLELQEIGGAFVYVKQ